MYSTLNEECRKLLADSDFDYDYSYGTTGQAFEEMKILAQENFGYFDVNVNVISTEVYEKDSQEFNDCLQNNFELYGDPSNIERFAKSVASIEVSYSYNGETYTENEEQEFYSLFVGGKWYVIE